MIHCLHGAVGSQADWDLFKESLGEELRPANLWELFDQNTPSLREAGRTIALQARQREVIMGYSMGGRLALHALLDDPQRWRAGIIIGAHPGLNSGKRERLLHDEQWATLAEENWSRFIAKWNQQSLLSASPPGLRQATSLNQSAVAASFRHWSLGTQDDLSSQLSKISCPLLWITGAKDIKFSTLAKKANTLIPNSRHQEIENAGHRVPWEQPSAFGAAVREFLVANP